mmetsp:Transcript_4623/g.9978  ORF Transcript_4623/g.9978 Transcript_4623/m.9978 type:complete len:88 (-) Transcript_4623:170-433(-)
MDPRARRRMTKLEIWQRTPTIGVNIRFCGTQTWNETSRFWRRWAYGNGLDVQQMGHRFDDAGGGCDRDRGDGNGGRDGGLRHLLTGN